jgi:hypothetical protein
MSGGTRHRPLSGKVNRQVRLRLRLASEDALGALRASSRPTNTGLEVHVHDTCLSGPPRMRYVPLSVNGSQPLRWLRCWPPAPPSDARALGRPLRPLKVTITSVMVTTSASDALPPPTVSPLGHGCSCA